GHRLVTLFAVHRPRRFQQLAGALLALLLAAQARRSPLFQVGFEYRHFCPCRLHSLLIYTIHRNTCCIKVQRLYRDVKYVREENQMKARSGLLLWATALPALTRAAATAAEPAAVPVTQTA